MPSATKRLAPVDNAAALQGIRNRAKAAGKKPNEDFVHRTYVKNLARKAHATAAAKPGSASSAKPRLSNPKLPRPPVRVTPPQASGLSRRTKGPAYSQRPG